MPDTTPNLGLYKPLVNDPTDQDLWGGYLNENADTLDTFLSTLYPVGSLYFNASNGTNPATLLGFGTWTAFGQGRVLLGVGTGTDSRAESKTFAAGATGGEYNHVLTTGEMPSHNHGVTDPGHSHSYALSPDGSGGGYHTTEPYQSASNGIDYTHNTTSSTTGITINNAGSGTAHNNQDPYIAVYIWRRTA